MFFGGDMIIIVLIECEENEVVKCYLDKLVILGMFIKLVNYFDVK